MTKERQIESKLEELGKEMNTIRPLHEWQEGYVRGARYVLGEIRRVLFSTDAGVDTFA